MLMNSFCGDALDYAATTSVKRGLVEPVRFDASLYERHGAIVHPVLRPSEATGQTGTFEATISKTSTGIVRFAISSTDSLIDVPLLEVTDTHKMLLGGVGFESISGKLERTPDGDSIEMVGNTPEGNQYSLPELDPTCIGLMIMKICDAVNTQASVTV